MKPIWSIMRKELAGYWGSPIALIFLAIFLGVTLFAFFWGSAFFARSLADIRPLFQWMPLLLIFLVATLTMRQWSEEQRAGTVETLFTLPVARWQLLLGKFLAVMALVSLALALTLPIPLVVAWLGPLDWGPVVGGYLAALLLAAAYTAIGLLMSSLTDNQIVALLLTAVVGGLLYLAGTPAILTWAGEPLGGWLRSIGTGSRFASIERGVVDLRDLVYYLSIILFFLVLTDFVFDRRRWGDGMQGASYRRNARLTLVLVGANLLALNVWLAPRWNLRADLTAQRIYSLSPTTKEMLDNLQEPLLVRAYVSQKSHPLLDPLRPQIEDMLREYAVAGGGKVTAEVVDPIQDPTLEAEANQTYGIQPTPFQVADRYQAALINAYFDVLIRYGDQNVVLNFRDLIQVQQQPDGAVEVGLRNLEYDLTRGIKKVLYGFQNVDTLLASQSEPVTLTLYATPDTLPAELAAAPATIAQVAAELGATSGGKVRFVQVDPDDPASGVTRQDLLRRYGLQPVATTLFSPDSFYLHMVVENGDATQVVYPAVDMREDAVRDAVAAAVLRTASGFLKVVGLWTPPEAPAADALGQLQAPLHSYNLLRDQLSQEYTVREVDLSSGEPPAGIDVLLLVAPQKLGEKELFAVDQYLMRGGSTVVLAGNYAVGTDPLGTQLALQPLEGTARDLLAHYGVQVGDALVMDLQNLPFPAQTVRDAGGFQVQEVQAIDYPFFVDVRTGGMDSTQGIAGGLPGVTLNWASPVTIDAAKTSSYTVSTLLQSSPDAWLRTDTNIQPDFALYPELGFPVEGELATHTLGVALQGAFPSYFQGKPHPLATAAPDASAAVTSTVPVVPKLDQATQDARLVVLGSGEFVDDYVLQLAASLVGDQVLNNLQYLQNAVDWSVEDTDLLTLRTRGTFTRLLDPLDPSEQRRWEGITYGLVLAGLALVTVAAYLRRRSERPMELLPRTEFRVMPPIG